MTTTRAGASLLRVSAVLLATLVAGGCSSQPVSQVHESVAPAESTGATGSAAPSVAAPVPTAGELATDEPATPSPTPGVPSKPANVTWKHLSSKSVGSGLTRETYRVAWDAPAGVATGFRIYGVKSCLRDAKQNDGKPCVVKGMRLPKGSLKLLKEVPGSARSADVAWRQGEIPVGPYYAVLVRAWNGAGDSIFSIAWSDSVCWACTY